MTKGASSHGEDRATAALPCIVCTKPLEGFFEDQNQPSCGTAFSSQGHYGSRTFDPMDGSAIEINVCDECLIARARIGAVAHYTAASPVRGGRMTLWAGRDSDAPNPRGSTQEREG